MVVRSALERAKLLQQSCNCFCLILEDEAIAAARYADKVQAEGGWLGPLHGVPVAIKDLTPTKGHLLTNGSWTSGEQTAQANAVIAQRLLDAGAILIGKTLTPEFAYSSFTHSPRWGVTINPWDRSRTSGGSSGGSAVAVAGGSVPFAEGSDMGGSVRIPASFCGVVGLKPSLGRIPMTILPSQFDDISHFGPLAQTVGDAILFMEAVCGPHDDDISSLPIAFDAKAARNVSLSGRRFALCMDLGYYQIDPEVERAVRRAAAVLERQGAIVEEVALPWTRAINDGWYDLWCVFMDAYFGQHLETFRKHMDPAVVGLIERGRTLAATDVKKVEILRTKMWRDLSALFARGFNALLSPTCAVPAPLASENDDDYVATLPDGRFKGLDMTCPFNMLSPCPALSLPVGETDAGLPVGLQIVGRRHADEEVLGMGLALEQALPQAGVPRLWPRL
ncbi:MAG TPA: amidase [Candidatus Sulfotelmatobacter sp.]|nr:amidase [Candidatus Sulfotelmatobacter sp.]